MKGVTEPSFHSSGRIYRACRPECEKKSSSPDPQYSQTLSRVMPTAFRVFHADFGDISPTDLDSYGILLKAQRPTYCLC